MRAQLLRKNFSRNLGRFEVGLNCFAPVLHVSFEKNTITKNLIMYFDHTLNTKSNFRLLIYLPVPCIGQLHISY